jgi:hypothetical protein
MATCDPSQPPPPRRKRLTSPPPLPSLLSVLARRQAIDTERQSQLVPETLKPMTTRRRVNKEWKVRWLVMRKLMVPLELRAGGGKGGSDDSTGSTGSSGRGGNTVEELGRRLKSSAEKMAIESSHTRSASLPRRLRRLTASLAQDGQGGVNAGQREGATEALPRAPRALRRAYRRMLDRLPAAVST